ncbi:LysE/ArgO family amino acid transporter [Candidatus Kinetoplastidibacterium crithidiae]|uniref:L-lysine exporter n=1 Tax=Candidatus Kinetoplastidibacterium crithidiae TCC036E TaxID=1208918 RepID=M1M786_9PROT|nr:LysE family transporter [Candidatus Kinetoplastibacterium crithidii]AFZ82951.1 L-lysine exporter family protein LysE/ArgO [Candidatus Kinetoplastibacterium crithidii (ex Angomonas deanei ATCC 30255)]AGF47950.1 L-lysine exporter [Candidatus Kinetoplastibacterium crithidii TCC036E]
MLTSFFSSITFQAWFNGLLTGLGLFAVVGAQSAFIIRQGLMRSHIMTIIIVCCLTDAIFIFASVIGLKELILLAPWFKDFILILGIIFLLCYSWKSAKKAFKKSSNIESTNYIIYSKQSVILTTLGFSLLNPHFWLDMILIGSLANVYENASMAYAFGSLTASILWLNLLGLGARLCAPIFSKPKAWRILDGTIAIIMIVMVILLLRQYMS